MILQFDLVEVVNDQHLGVFIHSPVFERLVVHVVCRPGDHVGSPGTVDEAGERVDVGVDDEHNTVASREPHDGLILSP